MPLTSDFAGCLTAKPILHALPHKCLPIELTPRSIHIQMEFSGSEAWPPDYVVGAKA